LLVKVKPAWSGRRASTATAIRNPAAQTRAILKESCRVRLIIEWVGSSPNGY
jgi:hypothetical protein